MINCKHIKVQENTTKYYYCTVKSKAVDEYKCKHCPLKLSTIPKEIEEVFGKGFRQ